MENINANRLKKGLSKIKKTVNDRIGPVWKLRKSEVITKIKGLSYKYNENTQELTSNRRFFMVRVQPKVKI